MADDQKQTAAERGTDVLAALNDEQRKQVSAMLAAKDEELAAANSDNDDVVAAKDRIIAAQEGTLVDLRAQLADVENRLDMQRTGDELFAILHGISPDDIAEHFHVSVDAVYALIDEFSKGFPHGEPARKD